MNPFTNPVFLTRILKAYLRDINRLKRLSQLELEKLRNKQFQKMVQRAYSVPIYSDLYKKHGINKNDIKTINNIQKLPIITKEDFAKYKPNDLISSSKNITDFVKVSTSGTTGKSLSIYVDMYEIIIGLFGYLRTIQDYGLHWRKNKLSIIGDFAAHTAESGYVRRGLQPNILSKNTFNTIQWLDTNDPPEKVINELNSFQPDFIGGYTGMLGHLAVLKKQGLGRNVNPTLIASTGALLDENLKKFIEKTFKTKVFEVYGATETGPIAYQCAHSGIYHIMSDYLHLEFIRDDGAYVKSKEAGHLIVTKLFGGGTPILRYNAINDIVAPLYESHGCTVSGDLIHKIYGRDKIRLYRKDGKIILASSLTSIFSRLLYELQTSKIREMKVIQKNLDEIEINVVIDEKLRNTDPPIEEIYKVFEKGFKEKFGKSTIVQCNEIKHVPRDEPRIISLVDPKSIKLSGYA